MELEQLKDKWLADEEQDGVRMRFEHQHFRSAMKLRADALQLERPP